MNRLTLVAILLIISGICIASNIYTLIPIYPDVATTIHISISQAGVGSSIFTFCYAFGLLAFGPMSELYGRKRIIVIGLLLSSVTTLFVAFSFNSWSLFISRGVQGFVLGSFAPVAFAYTFELFTEKTRILVLALINSGFLMAGILGQLASSIISTYLGWQAVFILFASCYFLIFLLSAKILPVIPKASHHQSHKLIMDFILLLKNPQLLRCYAITFTLLLSFITFYESLSRTYDEDTLSLIRALGLTGTFLSVFSGKMIQSYGAKFCLLISCFIGIISLTMLLLFHRDPILLALISIPFVSSISLLIPIVITIIGTIATKARGAATSFYSFILLFGASFGPILASLGSLPFVLMVLLFIFIGYIFIGVRMK